MKAIKKSLCFALAVLSAAFTARAADPVAVWSGFNQLASGTFTADIGGAVPDATTGAVTLGSRGIKFANIGDAWAGSTKGFTVAVKYSNFKSGTAASLVSLQQNSETTAAGIDKIGAWVNANGKVQGVWQGGTYGTANGTLPASGIVFVRYNDSNGTSVLLQNGTSLYAEGGLKSSNNNWGKSFAVGSFANGTSNVASGMTIEAVAIFDSRLSDPEIAAYEFPVPPIIFSNINCGADSSGGVGDYNPSSLTIPTSCGLPEGAELKIKSIAFAQETDRAWNYSADYITLNGIQSDIRNNNSQTLTAWSIGNKLEYKFSTDVIVKVGTQYPMTAILGGATTTKAAYPLRVRLFKTTAEEYGYIQLHTGMDLWRPAYEIVAEKVEPPASIPVPAVILSDAKLWLDASDENNFEFDENNKVTKWIDRSSSHHDATPASTSPNNVTNYGTREQVDGRWVYQMGNVSSGIDMSFTRITDIRTVFWVMDIKQDAKAFFLGDVGNSCYDFHRGNNGAYAAQPRPFNQAKLISCDGVAKQSSDIVPTGMHLYATILNSNASANRLSQDRTEGGRNGGRALSELIVFNRELTAEEMQEVSAYLNNKWLLSMMFSDPLATEGEKVPAGIYGEIIVPDTGIMATAFSQQTTINTAIGSPSGLFAHPSWGYIQPHTIGMWVKVDELPASGEKDIYGFSTDSNPSNGNNGYKLAVTAEGKLKIGRKNNDGGWNGGNYYTTSHQITVGEWFYLTVSFNRDTSITGSSSPVAIRIYVNGSQVFTQDNGFSADLGGNNFSAFYVGAGISAAGLYGDTTAVTDATIIKSWATNEMFVEMVPAGPTKATAQISENTDWSDIQWDDNVEPTAAMSVELTFDGSYTLTLNEEAVGRKFLIKGIDAANQIIKIAGSAANVAAFISKAALDSSFSGKIEYEFDCSAANFTADNALKNTIKSANANTKFIFKGAGNFGATLDYGNNVNATLNTHLVFDGGTHTFKYGQGSQSTDFGRGATSTDPTLYVKSGTTLNVHGKDMSGWTGNYNANAIIRVDDGGIANLCYNDGTFFYRHQLYLMPGAKVDIQTDQFFLQGGKTGNQIYVPDSNSTKPAVITGTIALHPDQNREFGIYVGKGSTLKIAKVGTNTNASNKNVVKYGEGTLIATDTVNLNTFEISLGTFGVEGAVSVSALTLNSSAMLDINSNAPIVTGNLSTPVSKQLNLTIAEPTHMMDVITLPAGTDMTGWTAVVNGNTTNPCELVAEGTTLKLKWKIPPTITVEADDVTIETADDWNGGVVTVGLGGLNVGDYAGEIGYRLKFGDKIVAGSAANGVATFTLSADEFTAGNIYRGTFELEYGTGNEPIVAAEVTVYAGEKTYGTKEGWINEQPEPLVFRSTGVYDPEGGASVEGGSIKFANPTDVVFTPTNSPADYVAKCDSEITFEIFSGEEAIPDDDDTVEEGLQAGVKIVDGGNGGVKFQFISGDEWIDGPTAALNTTYAVTVKFHYAKEEGDTDSVTYTVGETVQSCARRANTAEKLETISFADGTQIASLVGKCDIEVADPITKGMAPGAAEKELKATNETAAQTEAEKIPVLVPSEVEGGLTEGLDDAAAAKAKADYKAHFKVVAQKNASGKFVAIVMPTADAAEKAEDEVQKVSEDVLTEVTALTGDQTEGAATVENAVPGFFYGVAENGEVVNMKTAEPNEWKMAGASGKVELKVTKPANAKQRFYKIICTPVPPTVMPTEN